MAPRLRKFTLTLHVTASVGWLGAIAGFLALALSGLQTHDGAILRAAFLGMDWIGWFVLVPISFASLLTGLVQGLGTPWGIFRHYWVLFKLLINVLANVVLFVYMLELASVAGILERNEAGQLSALSPLLHASVALLLLLTATILSIYKPRGLTPYGWRKQQERRAWRLRQQARTNV
jgi:hypothetical protein